MSRVSFIVAFVLAVVPGGSALISAQTLAPQERLIAGEENAEDISIPMRSPGSAGSSASATHDRPLSAGSSLTTVVGGLAVCLAVFFLFVWVSKRQAPPGTALLPREVLESLGRVPLGHRQQLQLVRVGRKLVLLAVTPQGAEGVAEITDPAEVDRLVALCQQTQPNSVTASFRDVLTHYEEEPASPGFLGDGEPTDWELATRGVRRRPARREVANG